MSLRFDLSSKWSMRLVGFLAFSLWGTFANAGTVSRTIEARLLDTGVRWVPDTLELSSSSANSLRIINTTGRPQCFQIQNLGEPILLGPGETRILDIPEYQHGRFSLGCPGSEARGGEAVFR